MKHFFELIEGGVTAPKGFEAAGAEANIKYTNRLDMALIYSNTPCRAAGVFTSNVVKAAPVLWDKYVVEQGKPVQAVIVNAGIANACTGKVGYDYCKQTAERTGELFGIAKDAVLVASTGVIGRQLPIEKIKQGIEQLAERKAGTMEAGTMAAQAIMTTDTALKQVAVKVMLGNVEVKIGGMCKGSGMIHPNMCTMLGFITTDICMSKELLKEALSEDVQDTFNMVSVDGDTSTNDTLLLLSNGLAGNAEIKEKNQDYDTFLKALHYVNEVLAKKMAGDGEGATALFEAKVVGAASKEDAKKLSKSVICSSLTKAAIFGHDANWGRILCALGYSGVFFDPEKLSLYFEGGGKRIQIYADGTASDYSEQEASRILSQPEVTVVVDMKMGEAQACAWGCDLSYDYVKINADYRS